MTTFYTCIVTQVVTVTVTPGWIILCAYESFICQAYRAFCLLFILFYGQVFYSVLNNISLVIFTKATCLVVTEVEKSFGETHVFICKIIHLLESKTGMLFLWHASFCSTILYSDHTDLSAALASLFFSHVGGESIQREYRGV